MPNYEPTLETIRAAHARIREHIVRTPLLTPVELSECQGVDFSLKCENMQYCGAFKSRGACNAVFSLTDEQAREAFAPTRPEITPPPWLALRVVAVFPHIL